MIGNIVRIAAAKSPDQKEKTMKQINRDDFLPSNVSHLHNPPIGHGQASTNQELISIITANINTTLDKPILEIGTGTGYLTAILSMYNTHIYTMERIPDLAHKALHNLRDYQNVTVVLADGSEGWQAHAPYSNIICAAGVDEIPLQFIDQLTPGGNLIIAKRQSDNTYNLILITKEDKGTTQATLKKNITAVPLIKEVSQRGEKNIDN
jgi:protein-L-isoaspartate(D-aspartate) O-methyltransferase